MRWRQNSDAEKQKHGYEGFPLPSHEVLRRGPHLISGARKLGRGGISVVEAGTASFTPQ